MPDCCEDDAGDSKPVQCHLGEAEAGDGGAADKYDASVAIPVRTIGVVTAGVDEHHSVAARRWLSVRVCADGPSYLHRPPGTDSPTVARREFASGDSEKSGGFEWSGIEQDGPAVLAGRLICERESD